MLQLRPEIGPTKIWTMLQLRTEIGPTKNLPKFGVWTYQRMEGSYQKLHPEIDAKSRAMRARVLMQD
jgi:hypothetical protein